MRLSTRLSVLCTFVSFSLIGAGVTSAWGQVPIVTYYAPAPVVYSPVVPTVVYRPTTVYSVPTTVYSVPTTVYSVPVPAPAVYQPPQATVVYDNGPLGLGLFPRARVYYTPGFYAAPAASVAFPAVGSVNAGP